MDSLSGLNAYLNAFAYASSHEPAPTKTQTPPQPPAREPAQLPVEDLVQPGHEKSQSHVGRLAGDLGAASGVGAAVMGLGAGAALLLPGGEHMALELAEGSGITAALGGIGDHIEHLYERGKESVKHTWLSEAASLSGVVAGGLAAATGVAAAIPGGEHVALGLGVGAGLAGAADGVLDVLDHKYNAGGFRTDKRTARDIDAGSNAAAGVLCAANGVTAALKANPFLAAGVATVQGVVQTVQAIAHAHPSVRRPHDGEATGGGEKTGVVG